MIDWLKFVTRLGEPSREYINGLLVENKKKSAELEQKIALLSDVAPPYSSGDALLDYHGVELWHDLMDSKHSYRRKLEALILKSKDYERMLETPQ